MSHVTYQYNAVPLVKAGPAYRSADPVSLGTLETFRALPAAERPYTEYDYGIIAEIIQFAELRAQDEARKGKGSGEVTLPKLLKAYEVVLPRHGARPEEDIYYYRLLLKLSLDPDPDWWGKFGREAGQLGAKFHRRPSSPRARSPSPSRRSSSHTYAPASPSRTSSHSSLHHTRMPLPPRRPTSPPLPLPPRPTPLPPSRPACPPHAPLMCPPPPSAFNPITDIVSSPPAGSTGMGASMPPPALPPFTAAHTLSSGFGGRVQPAPPPSAAFSRYGPSAATTPAPFAYTPYMPPGVHPSYIQGYAPPAHASQLPCAYPPGSIADASLGGTKPPPPTVLPNPAAYGGQQGVQYGVQSARRVPRALLQSVDHDSDDSLECEAMYSDFRCLAKSFRTWRHHAAESAEERLAREEAIENWRIAVAFWEVHTARRCLQRWAAHRYVVLESALRFWQGASLRDAFEQWRKVTVYLKACGSLSNDHSARMRLGKAWGAWRKFVDFRQHKEQTLLKAVSFWLGRSLHVYFSAWQRYTEACLGSEERAVQFRMGRACLQVMAAWAGATKKLKRERLAAETITASMQARTCTRVLYTWLARSSNNKHQLALLRGAAKKMLNMRLLSAFNKLRENVMRKRSKLADMDKATLYFNNRTLSIVLPSWRLLVARKKEAEALADRHAHKVLRYLLVDGMQAWMAWHKQRVADKETLRFHAERAGGAKKLRVLVSWRNLTVRRRLDMQAFQDIAQVDVARIKQGVAARMQDAWRQLQCLHCVQHALGTSRGVRSLRSWRAVARTKRQRRARRAEALAVVQERQLSKLLVGWHSVAALSAEYKRVVRGARKRAARKISSEVLYALFAHVLKRRRKRSRAKAATVHFREQCQGSVMAVLWDNMLLGRHKRRQTGLADKQRTRALLDRAFYGWMQHQQAYEDKLGRALMFLSHSHNVLLMMVLKEWHRVAGLLAVKHDKVRLAVAHWLGERMSVCFWTWREQAMEAGRLKSKMAVACRVHKMGTLSKAFNHWLEFAQYKADVTKRVKGYLSILCGRKKAGCFLKLLANVERKRRSQEARAVHCRSLKRAVLRGWRARLNAAFTLEEKLQHVFAEMLGGTLRAAWDAWRSLLTLRQDKLELMHKVAYFWMSSQLRTAFDKLRQNVAQQQRERELLQRVMYFWMNGRLRWAFDVLRHNVRESRAKKEKMQRILFYWRNSRLRVAFETLRWYARRSLTTKAAVLARMGLTARAVLGAWREHARKMTRLRDIYSNLIEVTSDRRLAMAWKSWLDWIAKKRSGQLQNSRAVGYLRNMLLGRAWNTWREHHQLCQVAGKVMWRMLNLTLSRAFAGWQEIVQTKKEAKALCTQIILRLQHRELSAGLAAFKHNVLWQQAKRCADAHFFHVMGKQCLLAWRLAAKLGFALELWMGHTLRSAFEQWATVISEKKQFRITSGIVAQRWRNLEMLSAWNSWREFVEERQDAKELVAKALTFWTRKGMVACWQWWRDVTLWRRDMRNIAATVGAKIFHRQLLQCWNSWLEFMYLREAKSRAIACWQWKIVAGAFYSWHELTIKKVEGTAAALDIFHAIITRLASETTSSVFRAWHAHVVQITGLRHILQRLLSRLMEFAFYGWSEVARDLKYQRQAAECIIRVTSARPELGALMADIVRRWQRWPLHQAFYTWLQNVEDHRRQLEGAAKSLFAYTGCLMRKAFVSWVQHAVRKISTRNKTAHAQHCISHRKLNRVLHFWLALAKYLKYMKAAMGAISSKVAMRSKGVAWACWRHRIESVHIARNAMRKMMHSQLLGYWNQWRVFVQHAHENKEKIRVVVLRMQNMLLASSFSSWRAATNTYARKRQIMERVVAKFVHASLSRALGKWLDFWQARMRKTVADVHYYGRLLDEAWLGWREVVEEAAAMRGLEANRAVVCHRAMECWLRFTLESKRQKACMGAIQGAAVTRVLVHWRMQAKGRTALRKRYLRRALSGWYEQVLHLAQTRFKLQTATQILMLGTQARVLRSWLSYTQEQKLRRRVFVQKQRAVQEAIRIGDQIRIRRNTELLHTTLLAWHRKAGLLQQATARFGAIMKRGLASAFRIWHNHVVDLRAANNKALQHFRLSWQHRYLFAWQAAAADSREMSLEHEAVSEEHWFKRCAGGALQKWLLEVERGRSRLSALGHVLDIMKRAERKELLGAGWEAWRALVRRRASLVAGADMLSTARRTQIMQKVLDVWHQYAQAMMSQLDPSSPFVSPRTKQEDRRLIKRMALMLGNADVDMGSDNSEDLYRDVPMTERLDSALKANKDQQAVLSMGFGGSSRPVRPRAPSEEGDDEAGDVRGPSPSELSFKRAGSQQVPATPTLRLHFPQPTPALTQAAVAPQSPSATNLQLLQEQLAAAQAQVQQQQQQQGMPPPSPSYYGGPSPVPFRGMNAAAATGPVSVYGMVTPAPPGSPATARGGTAATPRSQATALRPGGTATAGMRSSILERSALRGGRLGGGPGVLGSPALMQQGPLTPEGEASDSGSSI